MKAAALRGALSDRARAGRIHVVSSFALDGVPSTKAAIKAIDTLTTGKKVLVILGRSEDTAWKSLRNLPTLHLLTPDQLNTYDVVNCDDVVFTREALDAFLAGPIATLAPTAISDTAKEA